MDEGPEENQKSTYHRGLGDQNNLSWQYIDPFDDRGVGASTVGIFAFGSVVVITVWDASRTGN